jgi:hypothetical protein
MSCILIHLSYPFYGAFFCPPWLYRATESIEPDAACLPVRYFLEMGQLQHSLSYFDELL